MFFTGSSKPTRSVPPRPARLGPTLSVGRMNRIRLLIILAASAAMLGLVATASSIPSTPELERKRGEAAAVLDQIREIDSTLDRIVDQWNGANVRLDATKRRLARTERQLELARTTSAEAQRRLADRVVALYTDGQPDTLEIILGAESFDDLLDKTETARHISDQDSRVVAQAADARRDLSRSTRELARLRTSQQRIVDDLRAKRQEIERTLAERQRLHDSIKDQIVDLEAEERARQERLRRELEQGPYQLAIAAPETVTTKQREGIEASISRLQCSPEGL